MADDYRKSHLPQFSLPPPTSMVPPPLKDIRRLVSEYLKPDKPATPPPSSPPLTSFEKTEDAPVEAAPEEAAAAPEWFLPMVKGYVNDGGNTTMSEVATQALINKFPPGEHWFRSIQELFLLEPDVAVREKIILTLMASHRIEFALMVHIYWGLMEEALKIGIDKPDCYEDAVNGISFVFVATGIYAGLDAFTFSADIMKKTMVKLESIQDPENAKITEVLGVVLS